MSIGVVLTCQHYFQRIHGRISQICRWNFNCTIRSFRDISIPVSAVIYDCRSLLELPRYTSAILPWSNAVGSPLEF